MKNERLLPTTWTISRVRSGNKALSFQAHCNFPNDTNISSQLRFDTWSERCHAAVVWFNKHCFDWPSFISMIFTHTFKMCRRSLNLLASIKKALRPENSFVLTGGKDFLRRTIDESSCYEKLPSVQNCVTRNYGWSLVIDVCPIQMVQSEWLTPSFVFPLYEQSINRLQVVCISVYIRYL